MKIGLIGAMKIETDALKALVEDAVCETVSGIEFVSGTIHGKAVVVAQCGIGKVFAALCAQTMILRYGVDKVINTGIAGTLSERLGLLDVAISTAVVQHDMDTSALGDPVGLISGLNVVEIPATEGLCREIARAGESLGFRCVSGVIASGDQFIGDPGKKAYIRDTFGAIACEMEGAAIGQVCYVNGVEFAILRTISDNADETAGAMEYPELCRRAAERAQQLMRKFLETNT